MTCWLSGLEMWAKPGVLNAWLRGISLYYSGCPYLPGTHCTPNLDGQVLGHHAVAGCQVSVHKLVGGKVGHAICDLTSHLHHIAQSWPWEPRVVLSQERELVRRNAEARSLPKD